MSIFFLYENQIKEKNRSMELFASFRPFLVKTMTFRSISSTGDRGNDGLKGERGIQGIIGPHGPEGIVFRCLVFELRFRELFFYQFSSFIYR